MKRYLNILLTVLLIVLQVSLFSRIQILGVTVNLALICVIVVASFTDSNVAVVNGIIAGIIYDVFACENVGLNLIVFSITSLIVGIIVKYMYKGSLMTTTSLVFVISLLYEVLIYVFNYVEKTSPYSYTVTYTIFIPQIIVNTIVSLCVFYIYKKLNKIDNRKYY